MGRDTDPTNFVLTNLYTLLGLQPVLLGLQPGLLGLQPGLLGLQPG